MATHSRPTPEGTLLKDALLRSGLSQRKAAERAGISETRWRQIVAGYQRVGGQEVAVTAPAETIARMALVLDVGADDLRQARRDDAAEVLAVLSEPPRAVRYDDDPHIRAVADLLATLPADAQREVLRRVQERRAQEQGHNEGTSSRSA
ncbi:helix-turn-helix domain-containing protein [Streptomyces sulphureus]|uniref:helix-turn-helix domain-containing protein n=1 Tax=Streptomyces sulphureus TaxID=47758 RepID=UPI0003634EF8|nr:helix-turn-helix transcriptional regulator [Streptomyces sulphureus]